MGAGEDAPSASTSSALRRMQVEGPQSPSASADDDPVAVDDLAFPAQPVDLRRPFNAQTLPPNVVGQCVPPVIFPSTPDLPGSRDYIMEYHPSVRVHRGEFARSTSLTDSKVHPGHGCLNCTINERPCNPSVEGNQKCYQCYHMTEACESPSGA